MGGGALGSKNVSKFVEFCHCEERSDVAIAKSLDIDEITTQSMIARNDNNFTLAPWGEGVRRTGEGSKVKIAQRVRDDMSILVHDNEIEKPDCHVADAPRNDNNRHAEFISASQTHPNLPLKREGRKSAFTLAEVLITLGIIGVVAALTLPSVITKFQQKSFSTAFKKEYSVLNNAINYLQINEDLNECDVKISYHTDPVTGRPINGYYDADTKDCREIKQSLIKMLNLSEVQKYSNYTPRDEVLENGGVAINRSVDYNGTVQLSNAFLAPDGAVFIFYNNPNLPDNGRLFTYVFIVIDVNGKKGPNRWGYDVFWLTLVKTSDNGLRLTDEYASLSEKGGSLPRNILLNEWGNDFVNYGWGNWK